MPGFRTSFQELPSEFAVFPLPGALLLPRGRLPLNIFEPRYLAMVEDSMAHGRMFAMIQPDPAAPETATGPGLFRVGCLGRLSSFSETDDGRYLITLTGLARFSVVTEIDPRRGYRRVIGDFSAFRGDLEDTGSDPIDRPVLLGVLRDYFAHRGVEANMDGIARLPDRSLVVTLAMICPFEPIEKQALLEAAPGAERLETLLALLRMGAAGPSGHSVS